MRLLGTIGGKWSENLDLLVSSVQDLLEAEAVWSRKYLDHSILQMGSAIAPIH